MGPGFGRLLHRCFRACGFDVFLLRNLDAALEERDRRRRQEYLARIAAIRARAAEGFAPAVRESLGGAEVNVAWVEADDLVAAACARLGPAESVLDIGCGIRPQRYVQPRVHICCEPCREYMDRLIVETEGEGGFVYLQCDAATALDLFPAGSVDAVFMLEVIEHMERDLAVQCLAGAARVARRYVAVSAPAGFLPQEAAGDGRDHWDMSGGDWQEHRSAWVPEDFPACEGWQVIACRDYHRRDAHGRPLDRPVGAMWAVKTIGAPANERADDGDLRRNPDEAPP